MLPGLNLPVSLAGLLGALRPCFTGPSFATFCGLVAGLAGQVRRILLAEKVRWRRTRSWAASTDPEFAPKGPQSWSSIPPRRRAPP